MGHSGFVYGGSLGFELIEYRGHIDRIPGKHGIGDHIETTGLIHLFVFLLPANLPSVCEEEEPPQGMERLAFVQLGVDSTPEFFTLQIAQNKDRLDQPPVLLKDTGQDVVLLQKLA